MLLRILSFLLVSILLVSCTPEKRPLISKETEDQILYVLPDGTMEFKGRLIDKDDVVIYEDGRGGERAAIKLIIPRKPDFYRDSITVERVDVIVPVERKKD